MDQLGLEPKNSWFTLSEADLAAKEAMAATAPAGGETQVVPSMGCQA